MILFLISTSGDVDVSLGTTGNHFANLKVEGRMPQLLAQLVNYKCDSKTLEEILGVIDKV